MTDDRLLQKSIELQARNKLIKEVNKPEQANLLTRLLAVPLGIGSVPDVIYHKNPLRYPQNIGKGVWTTLTGKNYIKGIKTGSDLLKKADVLQGDSIPENIANFVVSLGIDIGTDPLAYLKPVKALKTVDADKITKFMQVTGKKKAGLLKALKEENLTDVSKMIKRAGLDEKEQKRLVSLLNIKNYQTEKKLLFNLGGNRKAIIGEGEDVVNALDLLFNPVGAAFKGAKGVAKTVAPEQTEQVIQKFNRLFNLGGNLKRTGGTKMVEDLKQLIQRSPDERIRYMHKVELNDLSKEGIARLKRIDSDITDAMSKSLGGRLSPRRTEEIMERLKKKADIVIKKEKQQGTKNVKQLMDYINSKGNVEGIETDIPKVRADSKLTRTLDKIEDERLFDIESSKSFQQLMDALGGAKKNPRAIPKGKRSAYGVKMANKMDTLPESEWNIADKYAKEFEADRLAAELDKAGTTTGYAGNIDDPLMRTYDEILDLEDTLGIKSGNIEGSPEEYLARLRDMAKGSIPDIRRYPSDAINFVEKSVKNKQGLSKFARVVPTKTMVTAAKDGNEEAMLALASTFKKEFSKLKTKYRGTLNPEDAKELDVAMFEGLVKGIKNYDTKYLKNFNPKAFNKYISGYIKGSLDPLVAESRGIKLGTLKESQKLKKAQEQVEAMLQRDPSTNIVKELSKLGFTPDKIDSIKTNASPALGLLDIAGKTEPLEATVEKELAEKAVKDDDAFKVLLDRASQSADPLHKEVNEVIKSNIGFISGEQRRREFIKDIKKIDFEKDPEASDKLFKKLVHIELIKQNDELVSLIKRAKYDDGKIMASPKKIKGWKEIKGVEGLEGWYIPSELHDTLNSFYQSFNPTMTDNPGLMFFDQLTNSWKKIVTSASPWAVGYSVRNAVGDMMNMILGGYGDGNPTRMVQGLIKGNDFMQMLKYMEENGIEKARKKYSPEMITSFNKAFDLGVFSGKFNQIAEESGWLKNAEDLNPKEGWWKKNVVSKMEYRENWFRISNFLDAYDKTKNWQRAATIAKKSSLDFTNLTSFERRGMKRAIPFYGFLRANAEHQLNVYANNPHNLIKQQRIFDNIKNLFSGKDITEEDWDNMPDWLKQGLVVPISRDEKGTYRIMTNFGEPTQVYNNLVDLSSPKAFLSGIFSGANPLVKFPLEMLANFSTFRKDKVSNLVRGSYFQNFPQPVKDFLEYKSTGTVEDKYGRKVTAPVVNPQRAYLLNNMPFVSPFVVQAKNALDVQDKPVESLLNLTGVLGGKIRTRNTFADKRSADKPIDDMIQELISQ
jgi:hypothetical protein